MLSFVDYAVENEAHIKNMCVSFIYRNFQMWLHISYKTAQVC